MAGQIEKALDVVLARPSAGIPETLLQVEGRDRLAIEGDLDGAGCVEPGRRAGRKTGAVDVEEGR